MKSEMKRILIAMSIAAMMIGCTKDQNAPAPIEKVIINNPTTTHTPGIVMKNIHTYSFTKRVDGTGEVNGSITSLSITPDNYAYYYEINNGDTTLIDEGNASTYETYQFDGDTLRRVYYADNNPPTYSAWYISFKNDNIMQVGGYTYEIFENSEIFQQTYTQIFGDSSQFIMGWTMTYSKL